MIKMLDLPIDGAAFSIVSAAERGVYLVQVQAARKQGIESIGLRCSRQNLDALVQLFAEASDEALAMEAAPPRPSPGARVELAVSLGPPLPGMRVQHTPTPGERGRVVRIIHCRVEGEPVASPSINPIVHVLFDGQHEVLAFAPSCLRVIADEAAS